MPKHKFEVECPFKLTDKQRQVVRIATDPKTRIIIMDGYAGTGKSMLSVYVALKLISEKKYNHLLYIRSLVEAAHIKFGTLPGEAEEKFKPWVMPLYEKLEEIISTQLINQLFNEEKIKCLPVNYLRGATFRYNVAIIDEAQNNYFNELQTIITRLGKDCKMFIIGDTMQSDLYGKSGFPDLIKCFDNDISKEHGIHVIKFGEEDIMRDPLLKFIVKQLATILKKV